ncbi:MAG: hypothetical protein U0P45_08340 [Acidimicrobiales bacterium]
MTATNRRPPRAGDGSGRSIVLAVVAGTVLRLPWLARPLSSDEAGALVAARVWASGGRLYTDLFIDRPQGFLLPYLLADAVGSHRAATVRAIALLAGAITVLAAAAVARAASGRPAPAEAAAWLAAVIGASGAIEGYAANGELLAAACAVPAMAIAVAVAAGRRGDRWLVLAGVLAGSAATVKQSGADAALAVVAWLALAAWRRWAPPRRTAARAGWFAAGLAIPLVAAALHGATLGWDRYAYALVVFRLHARSAVAGAQLPRFGATLLIATVLFAVPTWFAVRRARQHPVPLRERIRPPHALVLCWLGAASLAFAVGGNYHRHYWVQVAFPLGVAVALGLGAASAPDAAPPSPAEVRPVLARALALPLAVTLLLVAVPGLERDPRVDRDAAVAAWVRAHRPMGSRELLPLCAEVTYQARTGQRPRFPYVWVDHVRAADGARRQLAALLDAGPSTAGGPVPAARALRPDRRGGPGPRGPLLPHRHRGRGGDLRAGQEQAAQPARQRLGLARRDGDLDGAPIRGHDHDVVLHPPERLGAEAHRAQVDVGHLLEREVDHVVRRGEAHGHRVVGGPPGVRGAERAHVHRGGRPRAPPPSRGAPQPARDARGRARLEGTGHLGRPLRPPERERAPARAPGPVRSHVDRRS